jgi:hypothetical protein
MRIDSNLRWRFPANQEMRRQMYHKYAALLLALGVSAVAAGLADAGEVGVLAIENNCGPLRVESRCIPGGRVIGTGPGQTSLPTTYKSAAGEGVCWYVATVPGKSYPVFNAIYSQAVTYFSTVCNLTVDVCHCNPNSN